MPERMNLQCELSVLCKAVRKAGETILLVANEGFSTAYKANRDPITVADFEANRILRETLMATFPDCGWLSEETRDSPERLMKKRVWIVDPIDGTKEFVSGIPEFAVSVALVNEGFPVLAAVYNPATGEFFTAIRNEGAWLNGSKIQANHPLRERLVVLASRSEIHRGEFQPFEPYAVIQPVGSIAYKLALIAAGRADATFSLGPKNEWDIAAGALLVEEAGGRVTDKEGLPLAFNRPNTLVNGIVATTRNAYRLTRALIDGVEKMKGNHLTVFPSFQN